jgi:hypothetical protein
MVTVAEAWDLITGEARAEPGWHARRIRLGSVCDIRSAIRAPDHVLAVLFEVGAQSIPPGVDLPNCLGFELGLETITPGPHGRLRMCLVLKDGRYRDVFATLSEDVVSAVAAAESEAQGVKLLLGRLHTWERFVSRFGPDRLSDERQLGLFAELVFLNDEIIPAASAASAVMAWRGPYMEAQDFRFGAVGVEVKATAAKSPVAFPVSNLDQLDAGVLDALLVFHASVETDAAHGSTLPEVVARTRASLAASDPAAATEFDASLIEAGYLDVHAVYYDRVFRVRDILWLQVQDGFPRLTRATVPSGIASATYSVTLDACSRYVVGAEEARRVLLARV